MFPPTFLYTQSWEDPRPDMQVLHCPPCPFASNYSLEHGKAFSASTSMCSAQWVERPASHIESDICLSCPVGAAGGQGRLVPDADQRWLQRHQHVPAGRRVSHSGGLQPRAERAAGDEGHRHPVGAVVCDVQELCLCICTIATPYAHQASWVLCCFAGGVQVRWCQAAHSEHLMSQVG